MAGVGGWKGALLQWPHLWEAENLSSNLDLWVTIKMGGKTIGHTIQNTLSAAVVIFTIPSDGALHCSCSGLACGRAGFSPEGLRLSALLTWFLTSPRLPLPLYLGFDRTVPSCVCQKPKVPSA